MVLARPISPPSEATQIPDYKEYPAGVDLLGCDMRPGRGRAIAWTIHRLGRQLCPSEYYQSEQCHWGLNSWFNAQRGMPQTRYGQVRLPPAVPSGVDRSQARSCREGRRERQ